MRAQLGSGEVTLRRWRDTAVTALYEVVQEALEHLRPWMAWVSDGYPMEAATTFVADTVVDWESGRAFNYGIFVSGRLAGATSLMARIGPGGLEIGYWLHPAYV